MSQIEAKVIKVIKGSFSEKQLLIRRGNLHYFGRTDENYWIKRALRNAE